MGQRSGYRPIGWQRKAMGDIIFDTLFSLYLICKVGSPPAPLRASDSGIVTGLSEWGGRQFTCIIKPQKSLS